MAMKDVVIGLGSIAAVAGCLALAGLGGASRASPTPVYNRPSAIFPAGDPVKGEALAAPCLACHGNAEIVLEDPPFHPPKLRYQRPASIFYALQDYRDGRRRSDLMTPMAKTLSDQDMRDVAAFLAAGPNRRRGAEPGGPKLATSWAHQEVGEVCGFCHGEAGLGDIEGYPAIAGQNQDYIEHALTAYRSGARSNPIMQVFARKLTPDQVSQLAVYFAAQPGLERNP